MCIQIFVIILNTSGSWCGTAMSSYPDNDEL